MRSPREGAGRPGSRGQGLQSGQRSESPVAPMASWAAAEWPACTESCGLCKTRTRLLPARRGSGWEAPRVDSSRHPTLTVPHGPVGAAPARPALLTAARCSPTAVMAASEFSGSSERLALTGQRVLSTGNCCKCPSRSPCQPPGDSLLWRCPPPGGRRGCLRAPAGTGRPEAEGGFEVRGCGALLGAWSPSLPISFIHGRNTHA